MKMIAGWFEGLDSKVLTLMSVTTRRERKIYIPITASFISAFKLCHSILLQY